MGCLQEEEGGAGYQLGGVVSSDREVSNVGFQRRDRELGKDDDKEGCWLVTTIGKSCLGVVGCDLSRTGKVVGRQLLRGEEGGFAVCNRDFLNFIIYPPKRRRFDARNIRMSLF